MVRRYKWNLRDKKKEQTKQSNTETDAWTCYQRGERSGVGEADEGDEEVQAFSHKHVSIGSGGIMRSIENALNNIVITRHRFTW